MLIFLTYFGEPFVWTRFNRKRHVDFKDVFPVYSCRVYILTPSELKCRVWSACCEENRWLVLSYNLLVSQSGDFSLRFVNLILERGSLVTGLAYTSVCYHSELLIHIEKYNQIDFSSYFNLLFSIPNFSNFKTSSNV